jgi:hypothetical protein
MRLPRILMQLCLVAAGCGCCATTHGLATSSPPSPTTEASRRSNVAIANANNEQRIEISNGVLSLSWKINGTTLVPETFSNRLSGETGSLGQEAFRIGLDGKMIKASAMKIVDGPRIETFAPDPKAIQAAARRSGKQIVVTLEDATGNLRAVWRVVSRDGTNYLRQELTLQVVRSAVPLRHVSLLELPLRFPYPAGSVAGSPIVAGNVFCGVEHPSADNEVLDSSAQCALDRTVDLEKGQVAAVSAVIGIARAGQLRRDFLAYIENERARPYQPLLHYNSWYDLGYFTPFHEADALGAINAFGVELVQKRGVKLDSFLFDDGWDNHQSLWDFNDGFPNGFTLLKEAAGRYGAAPGVWLSPWGGYDGPQKQRLEYGRKNDFETNEGGFALSGPKYYERFHHVCVEFVTKYGINQFKFDGTGNATGHIPGSRFGSDFEAAIQLIEDLKAQKPDLYVNLTTGTWPSPFWLRYADSIWRGGDDHNFTGVGTRRQRWITYRDGDTRRGIVAAGPLYPLNSLMLHGIIYARSANHLGDDPGNDFADDVHAYFGSGTQLQEMYITPSLLTKANWDTLAEAARWSRANADTLVDSHWIGGDPFKGEIYGWASWSPRKGILVLRNPSDQPGHISIDIEKAFELPAGAAREYRCKSPWVGDRNAAAVVLRAGQPRVFELGAFEVVTVDAIDN